MVGYVIALNSTEALRNYVWHGVYGYRLREGRRRTQGVLMTLADFASMRPGEVVFFLRERMIYGVGRLVALRQVGRPALCNWRNSYRNLGDVQGPLLWDKENGCDYIPWVCLFRPYPKFFESGVDMDEALQSDPSGALTRGLRLFSGRSFIKVEDDEASFLANLIYRRNRGLVDTGETEGAIESHASSFHSDLEARLDQSGHTVDVDDLVNHSVVHRQSTGLAEVTPEGHLQVWLAAYLSADPNSCARVFGDWSYINNQEPASPMKPREFMDHVDIFGYETEVLFEDMPPTTTRFAFIEVKSSVQSLPADPSQENLVVQAMKYADWIAMNRAGGDYSLVEGYVVAAGFSEDLLQFAGQAARKPYVVPRRPFRTSRWDGLHLLRYVPTEGRPALRFEEVPF